MQCNRDPVKNLDCCTNPGIFYFLLFIHLLYAYICFYFILQDFVTGTHLGVVSRLKGAQITCQIGVYNTSKYMHRYIGINLYFVLLDLQYLNQWLLSLL